MMVAYVYDGVGMVGQKKWHPSLKFHIFHTCVDCTCPRSGNEHEKAKWMKDIERGDLDPIEILLMFWSDDVTLI